MLNDRSERKKLSLSRHRKVTKKYSINYRIFHILFYPLPPTWYEKLPASPAIYLGLIFLLHIPFLTKTAYQMH